MKRYSIPCILIALFLFIATLITTDLLQAEGIEKDLGIPFYPGSKQTPNCVPLETDKNHQSFLNINLISSDNFKKVLAYYQEKLGKFSISKSQSSTKSALWNESTPKGYRIVTLVETQEGTKITITKRIW
jgi:biopolymer transport protein ExbD